ncbi:MAG: hypothetical protein KF851_14515 [Pirellulaceae bacterium]|nr:hypothetical protein [Pirellulaceae bacterium]
MDIFDSIVFVSIFDVIRNFLIFAFLLVVCFWPRQIGKPWFVIALTFWLVSSLYFAALYFVAKLTDNFQLYQNMETVTTFMRIVDFFSYPFLLIGFVRVGMATRSLIKKSQLATMSDQNDKPSLKPHRGDLVLSLGLVGLLGILPIALAAWVLGSSDFRRIRAGEMEPAGFAATLIGYLSGIAGTILFLIGMVAALIMIRNYALY